MSTLKNKIEDRLRFLTKLYEITGGSGNKIVNMFELGTELGFDREITSSIGQYLSGENLVKHMSIGGGIAITHTGVKAAEEALFQPAVTLRQDTNKENELSSTQKSEKKSHLVFISYDTRDIDLVNVIDTILQRVFKRQVKTFIAKRDIKPGDDAFKTMLHDNLANSTVVLAVCTKHSLTSPWLWFESGAGFGKSVLIPLWAGISPQEFKAPMTIFQGRKIDDKSEFNSLLSHISDVTKITYESLLSDDEFNILLNTSKKLTLSATNEEKEIINTEIKSASNMVSLNEKSPNSNTDGETLPLNGIDLLQQLISFAYSSDGLDMPSKEDANNWAMANFKSFPPVRMEHLKELVKFAYSPEGLNLPSKDEARTWAFNNIDSFTPEKIDRLKKLIKFAYSPNGLNLPSQENARSWAFEHNDNPDF